MSLRVDTASLITGAVVCGNRGLGELGQTIRLNTSDGTNGPGLIYPSLDGTSDDNKEFRLFIKQFPTAGTFFCYEDGSFDFTGAPDGSYALVTDLYEDGVLLGEITFNFTIGQAVISVDSTVSYVIRNILAKDSVVGYNIRNILAKDNSVTYEIRSILAKDFLASYDLRNLLNKDFEVSYVIDNNTFFTKDFNVVYNILRNVSSDAVVLVLRENVPITLIVK